MGDGYQATLTPRWRRALLVLAAVLVSPVLWLATAGPQPVLARTAAVLLAAGQVAALSRLDRSPRTVTAGILVAGAVLQLLVPGLGAGLAFVVLCTYAWARPAGESLWVLAATVVTVCAPAALQGRWGLAGGWLAASLLAWSWGALGRARGARREAEQRQAVLEERGRIARELHDVLSHTVSVMVVQAAAADDVFDRHPDQARAAIRRTEAAGREALAELRTFLRAVRADPHDSPPQPGLAAIEPLAGTMTAAGLTVTVHREGDGEPPAGVQLCAYRIVQEALTNTLRHADATEADVLVRITETRVEVTVQDDGRNKAADTPGNGIRGMRERAALLGGTLTAEPGPSGGFLVHAHLPWKAGQ